MASKLQQLQSKACQASQFAFKHGSAYYKQLLEQNKQYIQEPPSVEKCNHLSKQLLYTRLARFVFPFEISRLRNFLFMQCQLFHVTKFLDHEFPLANNRYASLFWVVRAFAIISDLLLLYAVFLVVMSHSGRNLTMSSTYGRTGRS